MGCVKSQNKPIKPVSNTVSPLATHQEQNSDPKPPTVKPISDGLEDISDIIEKIENRKNNNEFDDPIVDQLIKDLNLE